MTKDEALKMCLEYIETNAHERRLVRWAIKEALAQPERTWVGLTEVDILAESKHWRNPEDFKNGVYWAAGTLKEKNT